MRDSSVKILLKLVVQAALLSVTVFRFDSMGLLNLRSWEWGWLAVVIVAQALTLLLLVTAPCITAPFKDPLSLRLSRSGRGDRSPAAEELLHRQCTKVALWLQPCLAALCSSDVVYPQGPCHSASFAGPNSVVPSFYLTRRCRSCALGMQYPSRLTPRPPCSQPAFFLLRLELHRQRKRQMSTQRRAAKLAAWTIPLFEQTSEDFLHEINELLFVSGLSSDPSQPGPA